MFAAITSQQLMRFAKASKKSVEACEGHLCVWLLSVIEPNKGSFLSTSELQHAQRTESEGKFVDSAKQLVFLPEVIMVGRKKNVMIKKM